MLSGVVAVNFCPAPVHACCTRLLLMKPDIHPDYRPVVFQDSSSDFKFLTRSTIRTGETIVWDDGNTYPLVKLEVTSASHPFYTGKKSAVRATGQVEKFNKRFKKA